MRMKVSGTVTAANPGGYKHAAPVNLEHPVGSLMRVLKCISLNGMEDNDLCFIVWWDEIACMDVRVDR